MDILSTARAQTALTLGLDMLAFVVFIAFISAPLPAEWVS
jgi:hypothetical protein